MLELKAGEGEVERFGLQATERALRGAEPAAAQADAAIELTRPHVTPLTQALSASDPELAAFWTAEQGRYRYDYVTFRASFLPGAEGFDAARLAVQLGPAGPQDGVIAWSLAPLLLSDGTKAKESAKLGLDLKLLKVEIGAEEEAARQDWFLRAWKEHTPTPFWELRRSAAAEIAGTFRFHLVTRAPAGAAGFGTLSARATIKGRSFWIFRRADATAAQAEIRFDLPPHAA